MKEIVLMIFGVVFGVVAALWAYGLREEKPCQIDGPVKLESQIVQLSTRSFSVGQFNPIKCQLVTVTERISDTKSIAYEGCREGYK